MIDGTSVIKIPYVIEIKLPDGKDFLMEAGTYDVPMGLLKQAEDLKSFEVPNDLNLEQYKCVNEQSLKDASDALDKMERELEEKQLLQKT